MSEKYNWFGLFLTMYDELNTIVKNLSSQGKARNVIGNVAGRDPKEDRFLEIDKICEDHIISHITKSPYSVEVYSEHGHFVTNPQQKVSFILSVDPFDGTSLYKSGIPAEWWSVFLPQQQVMME